MVLSDRTIARLLAEGRIEIDPYDDRLLQPSSVDVRVDRYFRVFHNNRYPFIDVREEQEDLTELVEVDDDTPFVLHPGEFVLGSTLERIRLPGQRSACDDRCGSAAGGGSLQRRHVAAVDRKALPRDGESGPRQRRPIRDRDAAVGIDAVDVPLGQLEATQSGTFLPLRRIHLPLAIEIGDAARNPRPGRLSFQVMAEPFEDVVGRRDEPFPAAELRRRRRSSRTSRRRGRVG